MRLLWQSIVEQCSQVTEVWSTWLKYYKVACSNTTNSLKINACMLCVCVLFTRYCCVAEKIWRKLVRYLLT